MKKLIGIGSVMALGMAAVACGETPAESSSSTLEVTGTVDQRLRTLDNASAVAIGSDGRTYSAYLKSNGGFRLSLPVGHTYRVLIANSTANGELRQIGHLVNQTSAGKEDEIAVKAGGRLNLGTLRPAGSTSTGVKTACDCDEPAGGGKGGSADEKYPSDKYPSKDGANEKYPSDDEESSGDSKSGGGKGEADDDYESKPSDNAKDKICDDSADVELEPTNKPGDACAKGSSGKSAPKPVKKSCSTKDADKDGKDDVEPGAKDGTSPDKSGSSGGYPEKTGTGSKDPGAEPDPKGGSSGGSCNTCAPPPTSCNCSAQCGSGSCVASKCVAPPSSGGTKPSK